MENEITPEQETRCAPRYRFLIPLLIILAIAVFTTAVMLLWNAIMPGLTGWSTLTWPKALGLLVLCKILFGGFKGRSGHDGPPWKRWGGPKGGPASGERFNWRDDCKGMNDDQRQRLRDEWRKRCADKFKSHMRRYVGSAPFPVHVMHVRPAGRIGTHTALRANSVPIRSRSFPQRALRRKASLAFKLRTQRTTEAILPPSGQRSLLRPSVL